MDSNLFKNRLGELYDFSLVRNESGKGIITDRNSNQYEVNWNLNMDLKGELIVVITSDKSIPCVEEEFIIYNLEGYAIDNAWSVRGENIILNSEMFKSEINALMYIGTARIVEFKKNNYNTSKDDNLVLKAAMNNFNFKGLELTENGSIRSWNKFTSKTQNKCIEFRLKENSKELYELIQCKRIENAVMSYLSFNIDSKYKMCEIDDFLTDISWFISFITLNATFIPYLEILDNKDVIYKKMFGSRLNYKYSNNGIIDNFYIRSGIKNIIESNFKEYLLLKDDLEITKIINTLLKIEKESIIEYKLVFLILAYEELTTKFLLLNGKDEKTIKGYNIQQKIQQINSILKFIPSSHQGDDLRDNVRNDMFHFGDIPLLSFDEKKEIFNKYHELLYKILFKILKYNGKYISRITSESIDV